MNHFPISATVEEKFIWDALMAFVGNPYGAAGLMANLETKANKLQSSALGMTDEEFTAMMDAGAYDHFVGDGCGYGLAQWSTAPRKAALLARARNRGVSIGDLGMQLGFICNELAERPALLESLRNAASVWEAANEVLSLYVDSVN